MGADYHYSRDGQSFGPVSVEQLRQLAATGQLSGTDLVWKEGMPEWLPAARFKGLIPAAATALASATVPASSVAPASPMAPEVPAASVVAAAVVPSDEAAHEFRLSEPAPAPVMPPSAAVKPAVKSEPIDDATQAEVFARQAKEVAMKAGTDAWRAFKTLATNPIGGLRTAVDSLGTARAMQAGIVFAVFFELCVVVACRGFVEGFSPGLAFTTVGGHVTVTEPSGFSILLRTIVIGLVPFGIFIGGFAASRAIFKGRGTVQSDMFVAGASLIPAAVAVLAAWILGPYNADVVWLFFVFAATTTVLLLYSGLTTIEGIPDSAATLAVPLMILAAMYLCKIIAAIG